MKKIASILLIVFAAFLVAPTAVTLIKSNADVSLAFTVNEEENSERFEVKDKEVQLLSLYNLALEWENEEADHFHDYKENYKHIFFDVLYPPPELV